MGSPNRIPPLDSLLSSFHNLNLHPAYATSNLWRSIGVYGYPYSVPTYSQIIDAALTEHGSKTIQQILSFKIPAEIDIIFEAARESIFDLVTNQFGHHVFGNLIPLLVDHQLYHISTTLALHPAALVIVCIDRYGSPSIKRFIKQIAKIDQAVTVLVNCLHMGFKNLMIDQTGYHVILQCLESFSFHHTSLLYNAAINNIEFLGTDVTGCLALNRFISASKQPGRNNLLRKVSDFSVYLAQDRCGNFVVQGLLGLEHPEITEKICRMLEGSYVKMSILKESSHVVEKCLRSFGRIYAVQEFVMCPDKLLLQVAKDSFGNYVIQTAIKESRLRPECFALHCRLVKKIKLQVQYLKKGPGRNVANLIELLDKIEPEAYVLC